MNELGSFGPSPETPERTSASWERMVLTSPGCCQSAAPRDGEDGDGEGWLASRSRGGGARLRRRFSAVVDFVNFPSSSVFCNLFVVFSLFLLRNSIVNIIILSSYLFSSS